MTIDWNLLSPHDHKQLHCKLTMNPPKLYHYYKLEILLNLDDSELEPFKLILEKSRKL